MSIDYPPPTMMTNGKTYADEPWWQGKPDHGATTEPTTFTEAESLTWARCWAYGEAMGMTTREWHLMWPIVYGALNACAAAWPSEPLTAPVSDDGPIPRVPGPSSDGEAGRS